MRRGSPHQVVRVRLPDGSVREVEAAFTPFAIGDDPTHCSILCWLRRLSPEDVPPATEIECHLGFDDLTADEVLEE